MPEIITSFFDNIKQKTTNPFFGTLILVWLIRNWDLVFSLFNFDKKHNLTYKVAYINKYYHDKDLLGIFTNNIFIAFGLMVLAYVLIILSRIIVNVVDHRIIPYFNEKTVSKLVINRSSFDLVKKQRDEYVSLLQEENEKLIISEDKHSKIKKAYSELDLKYNELDQEHSSLVTKYNVLEEVHKVQDNKFAQLTLDIESAKLGSEILQKEVDEKIKEISELKKIYYHEFEKLKLYEENGEVNLDIRIPILLYSKFVELKLKKIDLPFLQISEDLFKKNDRLSSFNNEYINYFLELGLMSSSEPKSNTSKFNSNNTELTTLGKEIYFNRNVLDKKYKNDYNKN
ncbi:hypothetical protein ABGT15_04445 [Flavobacterium enshiense]|uniref:hypothetical protein n=1 Tax=Flavobacterium enshiense TaxID=1341165 RepID=UPI00345CD521